LLGYSKAKTERQPPGARVNPLKPSRGDKESECAFLVEVAHTHREATAQTCRAIYGLLSHAARKDRTAGLGGTIRTWSCSRLCLRFAETLRPARLCLGWRNFAGHVLWDATPPTLRSQAGHTFGGRVGSIKKCILN
jgi:hypothetical protein